ncbi:MAG: relaxase/mobilization nuclease domain-containing protein [Bacteroidota bacterium]|nr:relaxase/mobilization nuclease domain-containing protein [Bacteroidota bacterium]MDE2646269.1 relaxase/mobilization nuclease domain-containing protein [Bacteroidota bacterium]MXW33976.1 relaxase/mobilization nuclease domain-containing protein [Rhodothermaceae bacterium]MYE63709.1 relaxase/mobilization nuclease domain-containing protein [Rhodothermaceae bacterium]MYJ21564.1 relaxase/mobilization nuclease domain-containing protein [Rhodothermaceae bacterium]
MICASRLTNNFHAVARYLETPKSHRENQVRVAWIEGRNVISDENLQAAAREMRLIAAGAPRVRRPVLHMSISWAPDDDPSRSQMAEVSDRVLAKLNLQEHQVMLVAHGDEHYAHVHAITNRVHPITRRPRTLGFFYRDIEETLRKAEREMNFRETPGHCYQLPGQVPPDRRESLSKHAHKATQSRGEVPFQVLVRDAAEADFDAAGSWENLHARLDRRGLRLLPREKGLVVTDGHEFAKCSSVAKNASLRKLEARFGESWRSTEDISLDQQVQKLNQVKITDLTAIGRQSIAQEFIQLDKKAPGLKAKLGRAIYQSLKVLANDERQRGDLGL